MADGKIPSERALAQSGVWTEAIPTATYLGRALHQRTRDRTHQAREADREGVETLTEIGLISLFLAPYRGKTLTRYYAVLLDWYAWCIQARIRMLDARRYHIEAWEKAALDRGLAKSTVAGRMIPVRGFYRWAHQEGHLDRDPAAYAWTPTRPRRSNLKWLSRDQLAQALAASLTMGPPTSGLIHLLGLNGLRIGETIAARVEDLETVDGQTVLRLPSRKGGVMDRVALPAPTIRALDGCIRGRDRGTILQDGRKKLTQARVYRLCDQLSEAIGLDFRLRPHQLRATFVTLSLDAGVPLRDVIASAGWSTPTMVHYYDRAHASIRRNASHRLAAYVEP